MTTLDLTPLFRTSIGFDQMMDIIESMAAEGSSSGSGYPPYNIEKHSESEYRIVMAVAGFSEDDIEISLNDNVLFIKGRAKPADKGVEFLHKGIAQRGFERHFQVADFIEVGEADMENGLLTIRLFKKVVESEPVKIPINSKKIKHKVIEQK